jgi:hypothetical protein
MNRVDQSLIYGVHQMAAGISGKIGVVVGYQRMGTGVGKMREIDAR